CLAVNATSRVDSDGCHHLAIGRNSAAANAILPAMSCAQPETIAIASGDNELKSRLVRISATLAAVAVIAQPAVSSPVTDLRFANSSGLAPATSTPFLFTVLRI